MDSITSGFSLWYKPCNKNMLIQDSNKKICQRQDSDIKIYIA